MADAAAAEVITQKLKTRHDKYLQVSYTKSRGVFVSLTNHIHRQNKPSKLVNFESMRAFEDFEPEDVSNSNVLGACK